MSEPTTDSRDKAGLLKRAGLDTVDGAFAYAGGEVLSKPSLRSRQRLRLRLKDDSGQPVVWYLKRYGPEPWPVRLRRMLAGRGRVSRARIESENIGRLEAAGVPTMRAVTVGEELDRLGVRRSYIIVSAVPGDALERCLESFLRRRESDEQAVERFNDALVALVRRLHSAGYVHRDLYASHVFLDETPGAAKLYLIDLARMFAPQRRRFRWFVKDLAELKHSMPAAWVERYWREFLARYLGGAGRAPRWAAAIDRKVARIRRRAGPKAPPEEP